MKVFTVLSIDFDTFFPLPRYDDPAMQLYDWGSSEETTFMIDGIWPIRAMSFLAAGLPLPQTTGEEETFWERFTIAEDTPLYVAESHAAIVTILPPDDFAVVHSYDAHHDMGYHPIWKHRLAEGKVACDYWGAYVQTRMGSVHIHYPSWRKDRPEDASEASVRPVEIGLDLPDPEGPFDAVFVCRSGAWVPSWCEDAFWSFINRGPSIVITLDRLARRDFSMEEAQQLAESMRAARAAKDVIA